jgi:hypothetical protein
MAAKYGMPSWQRANLHMALLPPSIIGTVSPILADAYTHAQLNALFMSIGYPGDAPEGNKIEKCRNWLRRANNESDDAFSGGVRRVGRRRTGDAEERMVAL